MNKKIIAIVLAGGVGTRLFPLTEHRSKPAVPVAGKFKLIDIPLSNCIHAGIDRLFVLTQYNSASLNRHIKNTYQFSLFQKGFVDILAAEQTLDNENWFLGTADAVRQSMRHLEEHEYDHLLVLSGDQLYQMDFEQMFQEHICNDADLTIATIPVDEEDAPKFGIMKVAESGSIRSFVEKPAYAKLHRWKSQTAPNLTKSGRHYLASMGIYIFKKSVIRRLLQQYPDSIDFGKEIIPMAIAKGSRVFSFLYDDYWTDIGNIKSYFEANIALGKTQSQQSPMANRPRFKLFDQKNFIFAANESLVPTQIFNCWINESIITEGSWIAAKSINHSVIGSKHKIGYQTIIKRSILLSNDPQLSQSGPNGAPTIGQYCYIENAIIDKNCVIGNHVQIIGGHKLENTETDEYCIKDGIVIIKAGTRLPDHTTIGGTVEVEKKFNVVHLSV